MPDEISGIGKTHENARLICKKIILKMALSYRKTLKAMSARSGL
jgi:hypothetical protein